MHSAISHHLKPNAQPILKQQPLLPGQLPQFIYWAWHHIVLNIALASLDQLSRLCLLPASCEN